MKLSEAIRLGGMTKPQGFGQQSMYSVDAPCALGGALQAVGKQEAYPDYRTLFSEWPWCRSLTLCPEKDCIWTLAYGVIAHLNDQHHWTREKIANWVATVEPQTEEANEIEKPADIAVCV